MWTGSDVRKPPHLQGSGEVRGLRDTAYLSGSTLFALIVVIVRERVI